MKEDKNCSWFIHDEDYNIWLSDCSMDFRFDDDGPTENGFRFCPKCGKPIKVEDAP